MTRYKSVFFLILVMVLSSSARVVNAPGGSRADIQAAVNSAKTGDTVQIPAGNFVVSGGITVPGGITIMGAGRDRTTLRWGASNSAWMFTVNCSNGGRFVMNGFTIQGLNPSMTRGIKMINNCKDFRIYDNTFRKLNDRAIEIHGNTRGVVDHNNFIDNEPTAVVVYGDGDAAWKRPLTLGTAEAVYVEDNYFEQINVDDPTRVHHIASNNGSRYVFRHNTIKDGNINGNPVDAHGNKFYWPRGSRSYEIYDNTFYAVHRWAGLNIRGGDGVLFNNRFEGDYISPIHLIHEGRDGDGNCTYPCVDQIRRLHIWNNNYNGKSFSVYNRHPAIVGLNRDYFLSADKNYTPYQYPHPLAVSSAEPKTAVTPRKASVVSAGRLSLLGIMEKPGLVRVEYNLPDSRESELVRFDIFNSQGRLVRSISKNHSSAGKHQFIWDGKGSLNRPVADGFYKIVMTSGRQKVSAAVVFMR